jgi:hypothetical protein
LGYEVVLALEIIDQAPATTGLILHDQHFQLIARVVTDYR